jgi:hypothetical protein
MKKNNKNAATTALVSCGSIVASRARSRPNEEFFVVFMPREYTGRQKPWIGFAVDPPDWDLGISQEPNGGARVPGVA